MVIDIEDRGLQTLVDEPLRRDGNVIEIAIAAEYVVAGMMAGRSRERERRTLAIFAKSAVLGASGEPWARANV